MEAKKWDLKNFQKKVMIKFYDQTLYRLHLCLIIPLLFFQFVIIMGFFEK